MDRRRALAKLLGIGGGTIVTSTGLASLFSAPPARPSQGMAYRQGTVIAFNAATLENVVDVGGTSMENLPILGVGEATLITPGSIVGIAVFGDEGRGKTYAILGRFVVPNTAQAEEAVSLLNSSIYTSFISALETVPTGSFGDLATPGPSVTVPIGPNGRVLVVATAFVGISNTAAASVNNQTSIGLFMTGANTYSPTPLTDLQGVAQVASSKVVSSGTISQVNNGAGVITTVFSGLNQGDTTFTLKYVRAGTAGSSVIGNRSLTVFKL